MIEVVIVLAIIGILAALAMPSYIEYIRRGHRAEARASLWKAAQWLERTATANGVYPEKVELPTSLRSVPGGCYAIDATWTPTTFTVSASPQGAQSGDRCGTFRIDQAGNRQISGSAGDLEDCWGR